MFVLILEFDLKYLVILVIILLFVLLVKVKSKIFLGLMLLLSRYKICFIIVEVFFVLAFVMIKLCFCKVLVVFSCLGFNCKVFNKFYFRFKKFLGKSVFFKERCENKKCLLYIKFNFC